MTYWELKSQVSKLVPRLSVFLDQKQRQSLVKEKGRKSNYHQFNIETGEVDKKERLLNLEEMKSFIEISLRSQACPMSLNADVYDSKRCTYACRYCFADFARASLYSSFFDNTKGMGMRVCNPDFFKRELDELFKHRGSKKENLQDVAKAISMGMPIRLGIRFEDFIRPVETKHRIALELLNYLADNEYPVMVNTKSDMVGDDEYLKAFSRNKAKSAVHVTMISCDEKFLKDLEPGAPTFKERIQGCRNLSDAGIRVVARIEPFMTFMNDDKDMTDEYIERILDAGIRHMTFDSYSYSASGTGVKNNFARFGYDFERMYKIMSEAQWLGSLLLGKYMDYFRESGLQCSTFDAGNVPTNDDLVCCSVSDLFGLDRFCQGNTTSAIRFIMSRKGQKVTWGDYESHVAANNGFLSPVFKGEVKHLWNLSGDLSFALDHAAGLKPVGQDGDGLIWVFDKKYDGREEMLRRVI
jgi:DNA repair photolyase